MSIDFSPVIKTLDDHGVSAAIKHLVDGFGREGKLLAVTFAVDCAERGLPNFEAKFSDDRPRKAIELARLWVNGEANARCRQSAAVQATRVAAAAAADAAWAAYAATHTSGDAAAYAAHAAAYAAWAAYAATHTSGDAERKWQIARLREILSQ